MNEDNAEDYDKSGFDGLPQPEESDPLKLQSNLAQNQEM